MFYIRNKHTKGNPFPRWLLPLLKRKSIHPKVYDDDSFIFSDFAKSQIRVTTKSHRELFVTFPKLHDARSARVSQCHCSWLKLNEKCLHLRFDNEINWVPNKDHIKTFIVFRISQLTKLKWCIYHDGDIPCPPTKYHWTSWLSWPFVKYSTNI